MRCKLALAILLILSLTLMIGSCGQAQAQAQYSLGLQGITWNHSTISVLLVPQNGASWWNPSYLNATLRSIDEWNNAIQAFASNYSNFAYLSKLRMVPTVSNALNYGFDVYVSWTEALTPPSGEEIGLTKTTYSSSGTIINSTVSLAAEDSFGDVLNAVDMQNVALHEFGHCLGLGHSNYSGDVMYPTYTLNHPVKALSTLDLYGVATVFQWMSTSTQFNSANAQQTPTSVTLPSSIQYRYLPISYENLPPSTLSATSSPTLFPDLPQILFTCGQTVLTFAQTLLTYILQFFLLPRTLIPLLIAVSAVLVTEFLVARITRKSARKERLD